MPARWNEECKFVELYKQHPCLWDMNSAMYRRKDKRQSALEEVVREMALGNFTTEDANSKSKLYKRGLPNKVLQISVTISRC
jgi:hypothetical protein